MSLPVPASEAELQGAELSGLRIRWSAAQREWLFSHPLLVRSPANATDDYLSHFYGGGRMVPPIYMDCETVLKGRRVRYLQVRELEPKRRLQQLYEIRSCEWRPPSP